MSRRVRHAALALALAAGVASPSLGLAAEEGGIVLLVPQLSDRMESGRLTGLWVDLPKLAAARAHVAILRSEIVPYARITSSVPLSENYCCPLIARTAELEKDYSWIAPTQRIVFSAFVLKERTDPPRTVADLKRENIVALRGILEAQGLASLDLPASEANTGDQAVQMLLRGRATAVVLGTVGSWVAEAGGISLREAVRLAEWPGYFACSPKLDAAIARRLGEAIDDIFARGEDRGFAAADGLGEAYERMRPGAVATPEAEPAPAP
jgi:hypothetical protein